MSSFSLKMDCRSTGYLCTDALCTLMELTLLCKIKSPRISITAWYASLMQFLLDQKAKSTKKVAHNFIRSFCALVAGKLHLTARKLQLKAKAAQANATRLSCPPLLSIQREHNGDLFDPGTIITSQERARAMPCMGI